ncbi:MAG: helix-turn-helix domain-containing protein, partial [Bacteroidales bacterium]|nr:helix-turn-helix domain-containing protein [Bacteroidales bacterium]
TRVFDFPLNNHEHDSFMPINKIIPDSLWLELKNENCPQKRIGIFESFLFSISSMRDYKPDEIDIAYENIYTSGGTMKISSIITESGIDERSFRKVFKKRVGLSAKSLSRLVRISLLCKSLSETRDINLMDVVHMGNFFDQAHFDHEIKNIIGETPNKFFKRDLEFVRVFSGF